MGEGKVVGGRYLAKEIIWFAKENKNNTNHDISQQVTSADILLEILEHLARARKYFSQLSLLTFVTNSTSDR